MKSKKILSILLALIMIISCAPIYASAAISLTRNNVEIVPPTVSPAEIDYGTTLAAVTVTGGELWYVDPDTGTKTKVEGEFRFSSTTTKPGVNDAYAPSFKFYPTDTATYGTSSGTLTSTLTTIVSGTWPTIKVNGAETVLVEAPTPSSTTVGLGARLSTIKFTGGKVTDAAGTELTGGRWSFVNNRTTEEEGIFEEEIQWKKTGYNTIKTKITVTVKMFKTTLAEKPVMSELTIRDTYYPAACSVSKLSGGKVLDENGVEITDGTWTVTYPSESYIYEDTEVTATWKKTGYETITTTVVIPVLQNHSVYNIKSGAKFALSGQDFVYSPDIRFENLEIIPANITDKQGNPVAGKYSVRLSAADTGTGTDLTGPVPATSYSNGKPIARAYHITFTPDDPSLPVLSFSDFFGIISKADFTMSDDSEIVVMYGESKTALTDNSNKDLRYSTLKTVPEDAGVITVVWSKDEFDPSTADYGTVKVVEATVTPSSGNYNKQVLMIPVRVQNYIHDSNNPWYGFFTSLSFGGNQEESYDGIRNYKIDFTNKRLKGTVDLIINDEVYLSVSPDENGRFYAEGQWIAPASGDYTCKFEYKPSAEDTAVVSYPVYGESTFTIELRPYRTLTINVGEQVYTITDRAGSRVYFDWLDETGLKLEDFASWTFTDPNGKEFTPEKALENEDDPRQKASIHIIMPDHDTTATAKGASIGGGFGSDGGLGELWSFWQKLVNWLISIYRTIVEFLIPTVETF